MSGYDSLERKILRGDYRITDKALYGGLMYGGLILPTNFFKVIFTTIFPPIGELLNIISDYLVDEFPYVTWEALIQLIKNFQRVVYCFILTSMFYIPGLIYALSNIKCGGGDKIDSSKNQVYKIKKY